MRLSEVEDLLNNKYKEFNRLNFIESDPILIPHQFSIKEDIEISAFLTATIAWGQRKTIIYNANRLISFMDRSPYDFIRNFEPSDLKRLDGFVHRTFNEHDARFFFYSLQNIYHNHNGLENLFSQTFAQGKDMKEAIANFRNHFFELEHETRTMKHVSNPDKGSACKRINMFLRWMVRSDNKGVDFGIWKDIPASKLLLPLDIHTSKVSRKLGLLKRKSNDWKAVEEVSHSLKKFDPDDPIKYDFALFGLGAIDGFTK